MQYTHRRHHRRRRYYHRRHHNHRRHNHHHQFPMLTIMRLIQVVLCNVLWFMLYIRGAKPGPDPAPLNVLYPARGA